LAVGAAIVAFCVISKPAADLSVTSACAAPATRATVVMAAMSVFMAGVP